MNSYPDSEVQLKEEDEGSYVVVDRLGLHYPVRHASDLKGALMSLFRDRIPVGLPRSIEAIRDVSFTIRSGERVGIVGANGAGKSSLMRVIAGIYRPTRGRVESQGFIVPLLQVGLGFHFEMTARANILQAGIILGIDRRDMEARTQDILEFAELSGFADLPLKVLSSGMATRLAFATATEVSADILLLDEVFAAGDASFRERAVRRMEDLIDRTDIMITVSHSMPILRRLCSRVIWIASGEIQQDGKPAQVIDAYEKEMRLRSEESLWRLPEMVGRREGPAV